MANLATQAAKTVIARLVKLSETKGVKAAEESAIRSAKRLGVKVEDLMAHVHTKLAPAVEKTVGTPKPKVGQKPYAKALQELQNLHNQDMPDDVIHVTASAIAKKYGRDPEQVFRDMAHHGKIAGTAKEAFTDIPITPEHQNYAKQLGIDPATLGSVQMLKNEKGQVKIGYKLTPEEKAAIGTKQDTMWILAKNERDALKQFNDTHFELQGKVQELTPPTQSNVAPSAGQTAQPNTTTALTTGGGESVEATPLSAMERDALSKSGKEITGNEGNTPLTRTGQTTPERTGQMVPMEQTIIPNEPPNNPKLTPHPNEIGQGANQLASAEGGKLAQNGGQKLLGAGEAVGSKAGKMASTSGLGIPAAAAGLGVAAGGLITQSMNQDPQHAILIPEKYTPKITPEEQSRRDALGPSQIPGITAQQVAMDTASVVTTKGGNFPVFKKGSISAHAFREAFAQAREAGLKVFEFNGLRYTTKVK